MASRSLSCTISGKKYNFNKDYFDKKISDYTDEDNLRKYFITKKVKTYLNKGYSVQEIRNILNVKESDLPEADSEDMKELIDFHKVSGSATRKKIANTMNFAMTKSAPEVTALINNIRKHEE